MNIHTIELAVSEILTRKGASVFGRVGSEPPIIRDYRAETLGTFVAPIPGTPEPDWWDDGYRDYIRILVERHPKNVTEKQLLADHQVKDRLRNPDILTYQGIRRRGLVIQDRNRHEFYEIKPDSVNGERDGKEKIAALYKTYRKYGLPYWAGDTYMRDGGPKKIPIMYNAVFKHFMQILCKRFGFKSIRLFLVVRRPKPGLILYKVRVELEDEERKRFSSKRALEVARHSFATYVVCHCPELFNDLVVPLGDTTLDGDQVPQVSCNFDIVDEIKGMSKSLADVINFRALGLPEQEFMVCCDEQFYQNHVVALQSMPFLASPVSAWERYAAERPAFHVSSPLSALIGKSLDAMEFTEEVTREIMSQVRANPAIVSIIIVVAAVVVTAGIAAYLAPLVAETVSIGGAGMSLLSSEPILVETTPGIIQAFGRMAMNQGIIMRAATAEIAEVTAARGFMATGEAIGQLGVRGGALVSLSRALAQKEAMKMSVKVIGIAAGTILMLSARSAFAAEGPSADPIATEFSSLFIIPAAAVGGSMKLPRKHEKFDLNPFTISTSNLFFGQKPPKKNMARYLGYLTLS
jgi:hypothetical protein